MMKLPVASLFVLLAASCATGPNAIGARNESTFAAAVHPGGRRLRGRARAA